MIPVLSIPTLNQTDMLIRCLKSIDHPIEKLVVVNNSNRDLGKLPWNEIVITHPNAGVAQSWNEVIKLFPAPYWVLVNDDIQFMPGDLAEMERIAVEGGAMCSAVMSNHGASFFTVTQRGLIKVGLFDENFYPAYCEDLDWFHRAKLLDEKLIQATKIKSRHGLDGTGSQTVFTNEHYRKENERTYNNNAAYYRMKWGGNFRQETFAHPFNDPAWPVDVWRFEPQMRAINQWNV
jgi:GT2 family glycosyltransferase